MRCPKCDEPLTVNDLPHDDYFKCPHCGHEIYYDVPPVIHDPGEHEGQTGTMGLSDPPNLGKQS